MTSKININNLKDETIFDDTPGEKVESFSVTDPDTVRGDHLVFKLTGTYAADFQVVASGCSYVLELLPGMSLPNGIGPLGLTLTVTDVTSANTIVSAYASVSQAITVSTVAPTITTHAPSNMTVNTDYPFLDVLLSNTFSDPAGNSHLTYTASLASGAALPSWLAFIPYFDAFVGEPLYANNTVGVYDIKVTATDSLTHKTASVTFNITVNPDPIATNPIPNVTVNAGSAVNDTITTGFELIPGYLNTEISEIASLFKLSVNPSSCSVNTKAEFLNTDPAAYSHTHYGLTLSASIVGPAGAPKWLTFNPTTDAFTGTPTVAADIGTYSIAVTATNGQTGVPPAIDHFTLTVDGAIASAPSPLAFGNVTVGSSKTFTEMVSDTGNVPLTISSISFGGTNAAYFSDLTFKPLTIAAGSSGTISVTFTPPAGSNGTADTGTLVIHDNSYGAPTQTVNLTATGGSEITLASPAPKAPAATEYTTYTDTTAGALFNASSLFVNHNPSDTITYSVSGLPAGFSIDPSTGLIYGDSKVSGPFTASITATDSGGHLTTTVGLSVTAEPEITPVSSTPTPVTTNEYTNYTDTSVGVLLKASSLFVNHNPSDPTTYSASGLPTGLSIDRSTGAIYGESTISGAYTVKVTAADSSGPVTTTVSLSVTAEPEITPVSSTPASVTANEYTIYTDTSVGALLKASSLFVNHNLSDTHITYSLTPGSTLPTGLQLDSTTGNIFGDPPISGPFTFSITETGSAGSASATVNLTLTAEPEITPVSSTPTPITTNEYSTYTDTTGGALLNASSLFVNHNPSDTNISYSLTPGSTLPTGLQLDSTTGDISGFPTVSGPYSFSITETGSAGSASAAVSLTLTTEPEITPVSSTPTTVTGNEYTTYADTTGGALLDASSLFVNHNPLDTNISFSLTPGSTLPTGLQLDSTTGDISGFPTVSGPYSFSITETGSAGSASAAVNLTVSAEPEITPVSSTPTSVTTNEYSTYTDTTGGALLNASSLFVNHNPSDTNISYSLTPGSTLPTGLQLDSTTGNIFGDPTVSGPFTFSITETSSAGSASATVNLTLTAEPEITSVSSTPTSVTTNEYSTYTDTTGGALLNASSLFVNHNPSDTNISYSLTPGSTLPTGLQLDSTTGNIFGDPTISGPFTFSITETGSAGSASAAVSLTMTTEPEITPVSSTPTTVTGNEYTTYADTTGGALLDASSLFVNHNPLDTNISFSLTPGSTLPTGLQLDSTTGDISGFPTVSGPYSLSITETGSAGSASAAVSLTLTTEPEITPVSLTPTTVTGNEYTTYADTTGGALLDASSLFVNHNPLDTNISFSLTPGSTLPTGLQLDSTTGDISGFPTVSGPYSFSITETGSAGSASAAVSLTLTTEPEITPVSSTPTTVTGNEYTTYADITGGALLDASSLFVNHNPLDTNISFSLTPGSTLPTGLQLDSATGDIYGDPTVSGPFTFSITETGSNGSASAAMNLTLTAGSDLSVALPPPTAPTATEFTTYTDTNSGALFNASSLFTDSNPSDVITYSLKSGSSLPAGLSLDPSTGLIYGEATVYGNFTTSITATDAGGSVSANLGLVVNEALGDLLVQNGSNYYALSSPYPFTSVSNIATQGTSLGSVTDSSATFLGLAYVDSTSSLDDLVFKEGNSFYHLSANFENTIGNVSNISTQGVFEGKVTDPSATFIGLAHVDSTTSLDGFIFQTGSSYYELPANFANTIGTVSSISTQGVFEGKVTDPSVTFIGFAHVDLTTTLDSFIFQSGTSYYGLPAKFVNTAGTVSSISTQGTFIEKITDPNAILIGFGHLDSTSQGDQFIFKEGTTYYDLPVGHTTVSDVTTAGHSLGTILDSSLILGAGHLL